MKKGVKNKYGLSPVIASVLMILLVLVLAAMIFLWARGFISEQVEKFGNPIEGVCSRVDFRVEKTGNDLEIVNKGDVDIHHFDIKLFRDGNSEIAKFDFSIDAGQAVKKGIDLKMSDDREPNKTIIYPALIGNVRGENSNKVFTCMDVGVTL